MTSSRRRGTGDELIHKGLAIIGGDGRSYWMVSGPAGTSIEWDTVNIRLTYNQAVGGLGHIVASRFGADPKSQIDDAPVRMKSFLETGKVPSDAAWQHA